MPSSTSYDDGIRELADVLYWDKIRHAREQPPLEKLLAGFRLHEYASGITLAGIRYQNPGISEEDALRVLKERVAMQRRWDEVQ